MNILLTPSQQLPQASPAEGTGVGQGGLGQFSSSWTTRPPSTFSMTERPTSPDCSMSSSSSLTAESSVTGWRGWSSSVGRDPPARDRACAKDCRTALAPRTAESVGASAAGAAEGAVGAGTAGAPACAAGDGPVAQSGAGPVAEPQPALSCIDLPETGLRPASASAGAPREPGAEDEALPAAPPPAPPVPVEALLPGPADSCPAPASPHDERSAP